MKKPNIKVLFFKWVKSQYLNYTPKTKLVEMCDEVIKLHKENLPISKKSKKTKNSEKNKLFFYFCKINKQEKISKKEFTVLELKQIKKLSKKKIIVDKNCFYLSEKWILLKRKVHSLYKCGCMKCGKSNTETHIDHILPRSKFPLFEYDINNLQILCKKCNIEKSNKDFTDYRTLLQKQICSLKYI
jgi:5-methylcytosine-specific restriction endonuclease McrA